MAQSGESTFPVRQQSRHVCNPNPDTFPLVGAAVKAMLSLRQRQTLTIHSGSSNSLLESLAACSLPARVVPTNIGGSLHLSLEEQVAARLAVEGQRDNIVCCVGTYQMLHRIQNLASYHRRAAHQHI